MDSVTSAQQQLGPVDRRGNEDQPVSSAAVATQPSRQNSTAAAAVAAAVAAEAAASAASTAVATQQPGTFLSDTGSSHLGLQAALMRPQQLPQNAVHAQLHAQQLAQQQLLEHQRLILQHQHQQMAQQAYQQQMLLEQTRALADQLRQHEEGDRGKANRAKSDNTGTGSDSGDAGARKKRSTGDGGAPVNAEQDPNKVNALQSAAGSGRGGAEIDEEEEEEAGYDEDDGESGYRNDSLDGGGEDSRYMSNKERNRMHARNTRERKKKLMCTLEAQVRLLFEQRRELIRMETDAQTASILMALGEDEDEKSAKLKAAVARTSVSDSDVPTSMQDVQKRINAKLQLTLDEECSLYDPLAAARSSEVLTEAELKASRKVRNRRHAKRTRLRKKLFVEEMRLVTAALAKDVEHRKQRIVQAFPENASLLHSIAQRYEAEFQRREANVNELFSHDLGTQASELARVTQMVIEMTNAAVKSTGQPGAAPVSSGVRHHSVLSQSDPSWPPSADTSSSSTSSSAASSSSSSSSSSITASSTQAPSVLEQSGKNQLVDAHATLTALQQPATSTSAPTWKANTSASTTAGPATTTTIAPTALTSATKVNATAPATAPLPPLPQRSTTTTSASNAAAPSRTPTTESGEAAFLGYEKNGALTKRLRVADPSHAVGGGLHILGNTVPPTALGMATSPSSLPFPTMQVGAPGFPVTASFLGLQQPQVGTEPLLQQQQQQLLQQMMLSQVPMPANFMMLPGQSLSNAAMPLGQAAPFLPFPASTAPPGSGVATTFPPAAVQAHAHTVAALAFPPPPANHHSAHPVPVAAMESASAKRKHEQLSGAALARPAVSGISSSSSSSSASSSSATNALEQFQSPNNANGPC